MTGSPNSWVNGKLGKAAHFEGNTANVIYNNTTEFNYTDNFSVALWVKPNYTGTRTQYLFTVGRADTGGYGYGLQVADATKLTFRFGSTYKQVACNTGEWHHFVMYVIDSKLYVYKDGELQNGNGTATILPTYSDGNGLGIGCFHYSGNIYPGYGDVCDFRIYDHALSPREVKEISKGLVCHYTLSGVGGENLSNFSSYTNNWSMDALTGTNYTDDVYGNVIKLSTSAASKRMYHTVSNVWTSGQKYAVSFLAKAESSGVTCDMSRSLANVSETFSLSEDWKRYIGTITCTETTSGGTLSFRIHQANAVVYITQIKLEYGTVATPYIPHSSDPLYTKMGFDDGIEYDVSGYGNNGTKTGTITYDVDTPRYWTCSKFDTNMDIQSDNPLSSPCTQFTVAGWVNLTTGYTANNGFHIFGFDGTYGRICISKDGQAVRVLLKDSTTNCVGGSTMAASALTAEKWNHYAITFDNGTLKIYINGLLDSTTAASITSVTFPSTYIRIGRHGTEQPKGKASDIRFYATALSAEDILALYNNPVSLTSNGALMTQGEVTE